MNKWLKSKQAKDKYAENPIVFDGCNDVIDVVVYDRALSDCQIQTAYWAKCSEYDVKWKYAYLKIEFDKLKLEQEHKTLQANYKLALVEIKNLRLELEAVLTPPEVCGFAPMSTDDLGV